VSDICVIGGGPAGSTFAARMAQFGHRVCLIERARFPRLHLGESLSPGVLPLLETTDVRKAVETAGFRSVRKVLVKWDKGVQERLDPQSQGLLVDRGHFDLLLLERARLLGVRVLQPAAVRERRLHDEGWTLTVDSDDGTLNLHADFVADATGRSGGLQRLRRRTGCRTFAVYAYWRGIDLPQQPRIEAGDEAWYWGVPLPNGTYNTLIFVETERLKHVRARFGEMIERSALMLGCSEARRVSPVLTADATPYIEDAIVSSRSIKIGDAALAIDPLSSSGVQKAIQSALAGAVVANTLLRKPESTDAALKFYRQTIADASARHCRWASSHYASVAATNGRTFWQSRGNFSTEEKLSQNGDSEQFQGSKKLLTVPVLVPVLQARVGLSPQLEFVDLPCIEGEFVSVKPALRHPGLDGPVAYVGGWELAPLLRQLPAGLTALQIARSWSGRVPLECGLALAGWLLRNGILVQS
jgi:flavin-dependent dehydrogenase